MLAEWKEECVKLWLLQTNNIDSTTGGGGGTHFMKPVAEEYTPIEEIKYGGHSYRRNQIRMTFI